MADLSGAALIEKCEKRIGTPEAQMKKRTLLGEQPSAGLFRLPFELRRQIYHYCIPRKRVVEVNRPLFEWLDDDDTLDLDTLEKELENYDVDFEDIYPNRTKNSIFLLSKQISNEALDILYGDNIFKLYLNGAGEYYLKKIFAESNRRRMRYLLLIARPIGVSYPEKVPDNELWPSVLPTLQVLRIVAEQPVRASSYYNAPTLKQETDSWVKWIRPFLQCFGRHVSDRTIVEVDVDGRTETIELVKEHLAGHYREIRCRRVGDLIFKRGRFSIESGYGDYDGDV